jgi:hypothetical protein
MKKIISAALLLCVVVLFSCKDKDAKYVFPYTGNWGGTYTYNNLINGTWDGTISDDGTFKGSASNPIMPTVKVEMNGTVSSTGAINATYQYMNYSVVFAGQIMGDSASGTWTTDTMNITGTWKGARKK